MSHLDYFLGQEEDQIVPFRTDTISFFPMFETEFESKDEKRDQMVKEMDATNRLFYRCLQKMFSKSQSTMRHMVLDPSNGYEHFLKDMERAYIHNLVCEPGIMIHAIILLARLLDKDPNLAYSFQFMPVLIALLLAHKTQMDNVYKNSYFASVYLKELTWFHHLSAAANNTEPWCAVSLLNHLEVSFIRMIDFELSATPQEVSKVLAKIKTMIR